MEKKKWSRGDNNKDTVQFLEQSAPVNQIRITQSDISGWEWRCPRINRSIKVSPPEDHFLSKRKGKEVWHPWPAQTTSERQRRQMNCLGHCWAPLGLYKWLFICLPLVVCVCTVFNGCFTYEDSSITNEGRTPLFYCSRMPDTKLCTLYWKLFNVGSKKRSGFSTTCSGLITGDALSGTNNDQ